MDLDLIKDLRIWTSAIFKNLPMNEGSSLDKDGVNHQAVYYLDKMASHVAKKSFKADDRKKTNDLDVTVLMHFNIVANFKSDQYFVKYHSRPNAVPRVIVVIKNSMIRSDGS